jgi:hypothetical protein
MVNGRSLSHNLSGLAVLGVWGLIGVALAVRGFSWDSKRE